MINKLILLFLLLLNIAAFGQRLNLQLIGETKSETKKIDSLGYISKHADLKSIKIETENLIQQFQKLGYFTIQSKEFIKVSDSLFLGSLALGKQQKSITLHIKENDLIMLQNSKTEQTIASQDLELFLKQLLKRAESKGFSLAKISLENITVKTDVVTANVKLELGEKRLVNDIVINGYDKFPESHKLALRRFYKSKIFNQQNLDKLYKNVSQFQFVKQIKYPEILFTTDSTKVFVYVQKNNSNSFDGLIGFANDDNQKLVFTGYVNVALQNIINSGEKFSLYWKNDGQQQTTFNVGLELPYLFKTNLGLKAQLNIFKQDSTFQTTQTNLNLGYYFNYNSRLYLGYQSAESSDIQNTNSFVLNDFKNNFVTSTFESQRLDANQIIFPEKLYFLLKLGSGTRNAKLQTDSQFFVQLNANYHLELNNRNSVSLKTQNYYLQSDTYIINELQRFGGINSIRGFNENSLQANAFSGIFTEYRYTLSPNLYVHSVIDYAYVEDKTFNFKDRLLGLGFGFGLLTKNGLFNLVYANGSTKDQAIKLSNSIIQISLRAKF
jgi:hypothetical protein